MSIDLSTLATLNCNSGTINMSGNSELVLSNTSAINLNSTSSLKLNAGSTIKLQPTASVGIMTITPDTLLANQAISIYDPKADCVLLLGVKKILPAIVGVSTLTKAMSGCVIKFNNTSAYTINLPTTATSEGVNYVITQATAAAAFTVTIHSDGANIIGVIRNNSGAGTQNTTSAGSRTNVLFLTGASQSGDTVRVYCTGSMWICDGFSSNAAGMTYS